MFECVVSLLSADILQDVDAAYRDRTRWTRMSIFSIARAGVFSSDRTIQQYAKEIWNVKPMRRTGPSATTVSDLVGASSCCDFVCMFYSNAENCSL